MFLGLQDDIVESFDNSMVKINLLNDNFALQVQTDNMKMLEAYDAIQQGVVRLKTNMLSIHLPSDPNRLINCRHYSQDPTEKRKDVHVEVPLLRTGQPLHNSY